MAQRFDESIFENQTPGTGLVPQGMGTVTNGLLVPLDVRERLRHFDPDIFDLTAESNLTRFMSVLLGEAGTGQVRKQQVMRRIAQQVDGAHFLDLDAFYGAILGFGRLVDEDIPGVRNKTDTAANWDTYRVRDGKYRSRVEQFARALNLGPTEHALRLAAKVLLGDDTEVFEAWRYIDHAADMDTQIGRGSDRREIVLRPARDISAYERRVVLRALKPLIPADATLSVETTGIGGYVESSINGAWSPDDDYEIVLRVTEGGVTEERQRPPLSAYQSDAWSVLHNLQTITSSSSNDDPYNYSRVTFPNGSTVDYIAKSALIRDSEVRSGRLASNGILLRHPYTDIRSEEREPTSVLYLDREPITTVDRQRTAEEPAKFWVSKRRHQDDQTLEYLTTTFSAPQAVNHVSLEFSRFPCRVAVQVMEEGGEWETVASVRETQSLPDREHEPSVSVDGSLLHPLHRGIRHWRKLSETFDARRAVALRVVMQRTQGMPPIDVSDYPVAYSLAVRRLDVGYRIRSREDFPAEPIDVSGSLLLGASVQDGNIYEYLAHQRRATNLIDDTSTIWKSLPQPVPDAVVPLYLDLRDGRGANVTSRIDLDPVTEGATINVYRATTAPIAPAPAATRNLSDEVTTVADGNGDVPLMVTEGWRFNANNGYTLPVKTLGIGDDTPFWVGLQYRPDAASTAWGGDYPLDIGGLRIRLLADSLRIESGTWAVERYVEVPAQGVSTILVGFNPRTGALTVRSKSIAGSKEFSATIPEADRPSGSTVSIGFFPGNILALGIFSYAQYDAETAAAFEDDPVLFLSPPNPWDDREDRTANLCLRFTPALREVDDDGLGFSGGPSIPYEAIEWRAVPGSFRLKRGALLMPPALTSFLKLEFSDLSPEPIAGFYPTARRYRVFPQSIVERGKDIAADYDYRLSDGGQRTLSVLGRDRFDDRERNLRLTMRGPLDADQHPITEALVADDLSAQQRLREASWLFGFTRWQTDRRTASMGDGVHSYAEKTAINLFGIGYTVGLRHLTVYDDDYTAATDTRAYVENFQSADRWTLDGGLEHAPGHLSQTGGLWGEAISEVWNSTSPIEAIQFAALTSPPRPMLDNEHFDFDDDYRFDDPNDWRTIGDAQAFVIEDGVRVDRRQYATNFTLDGMPYGDSPAGLVDSNDPSTEVVDSTGEVVDNHDGSTSPGAEDDLEDFTYGELEALSQGAGVEGGIESELAFLSSAGTLRAVVRITGVLDTADNPVLIQIVREEDDTVVAQTGVVAVPGQTVEADIEFGIEQSADFVQYTYGDHEASTYEQLEVSSYQQLEVYSLTIGLNEGFRLRVVQELVPAGVWVVGKASLFEDTVRWEFSNDGGTTWVLAGGVANNPDGAVSFLQPGTELVVRFTTLAPRAGISALQIRPFYLTRRSEDPMLRATTDGATEAPSEVLRPIREDPMFKMWSQPIPREWYLTS